MSEQTRATDGGLSLPSRRGRNKGTANGSFNGSAEHAGGTSELNAGSEGTLPESQQPEPGPGPERIGGFATVDPFTAGEPSGSEPVRKRRGRKPGTSAKAQAIRNLDSLANIEACLVSACFFIGNACSAPELYADEDEAAKVADAVREFAKHHAIGVTDKRLSEFNLAMVGGAFVGMRLVALWKRPRAPKKPGPVLEMPRTAAPSQAPGMPTAAPPPIPEPGPMVAPSSFDP